MIVALISLYQLIPCRVRKRWSFGTSSSGLALAMARDGHGMEALWRYAIMPAWHMITERGGGSWSDPRDI